MRRRSPEGDAAVIDAATSGGPAVTRGFVAARREAGAWSRALRCLVAAGFALSLASSADAQGVAFGPNHRVPRAHDTDIGADSTGDPHLDFMLHCQGCHQAGGLGLEGAVPALRDSVARFVSLPGGREYLASVPGVAQSQLDDEAIASLLNWMVAYFDPGHLPADFQPFTAEEVGPRRRHPLVAASARRAQILAAGGAPAAGD